MNRRSLVLLSLATLAARDLAGQSLSLQVANLSPIPRQGEVVAIRLDNLKQLLPSLDPARILILQSDGATRAVSQLTDTEILFAADCEASGTRNYIIRQEPDVVRPGPSLVDGRYVLPRGDYAWENDRIAFRMYGSALAGDVRNGIDVWTKRVRSLIVGKWYRESEGSAPGKDAYHIDRGEGADFFSVGRSLGAGGSGIWSNGRVYQPGVFSSWRTVANGPLRVCFELTYDSVRVENTVYSETRRITLDAGENLCSIAVTYHGPRPGKSVQYALGLVKRRDTRLTKDQGTRRMSLWGPTNAEAANGELGTAVMIPQDAFVGFAEDSSQYFLIGTGTTGVPHMYFAGAGWTRSGDFASESTWHEYVSGFAARRQAPLGVRVAAGR